MVNYQNRFSNAYDDNNHTIEDCDEDDCDNGNNQNRPWNDNSRQDDTDDYSDQYQYQYQSNESLFSFCSTSFKHG